MAVKITADTAKSREMITRAVQIAIPGAQEGAIRAFVKGVWLHSQRHCPVRTGNLKRSGYHRLAGPERGEAGYSAGYAAYVDRGTWKMAPRWFFTNAVTYMFLRAPKLVSGKFRELMR